MLKAILSFLFGKQANIFDSKGRVEHKFQDKKWTQWDHRLSNNPDYNWRQHAGTEQKNIKPN